LEEAKEQQQQEKVATLVAKGAGGWQPVELSEMLGPLLESVVVCGGRAIGGRVRRLRVGVEKAAAVRVPGGD